MAIFEENLRTSIVERNVAAEDEVHAGVMNQRLLDTFSNFLFLRHTGFLAREGVDGHSLGGNGHIGSGITVRVRVTSLWPGVSS